MAIPVASVRMDVEKTTRLCEQILTKAGVEPQDAARVADNLIQADLRGISSHGISRMMVYTTRILRGLTNLHPDIRVVRETPGSLLIDGDNGLGAVIGTRAMEQTIEKARKNGVALTTVRGGTHYGFAAYYAMMAAKQDMIGIALTNAPSTMAPWGGMRPILGTNPFAFAIPAYRRDLFVLDCATSVVARGKVVLANIEGAPIPEGWALDREGNPTTNAAAGLEGTVLPFGTYKGSGISILIDILCALLSGAAFGSHVGELYGDYTDPQNLGYCFGAIDLRAFGDPEAFKKRMDQMMEELKACQKAPGVEEIYMPGEPERLNERRNRELGIEVGPGVLRDLNTLCERVGLQMRAEDCLRG